MFHFDVLFREKSDESQTEDESSHSAEASNLTATQPHVSEEIELTESTGEEDEKHDITEEHVISAEKELSDEESVIRLRAAHAQSDELSGTEEEDDPTTFGGTAGEQYSSPTDLSSFRRISKVDVCAQELGTVEDEGGEVLETAAEDKDIVDSKEEEKTEVEEPVEVYPYSGLADVDVCATELVGAERTVEGSRAEDNTLIIEEESSKPQPEETVVQDNQQVAEDQAEKAKEEEGRETETPYGGTHESLTHIEGDLDSNVIPKEDSFVEISFEDVPEAQQNTEVGEKQPEVLNTNILEMQQEEESEEVSASATDQNISGTQDHDEPETVGAEKELNPEGEEMERQHEASDVTKEKVETADSNSNDSEDDENGEGVKTISSSHQPTSEAVAESPEHETDLKNEETEEISEREFHQNEWNNPDVKEEDKTDTMEGKEEEDMQTEGHGEVEDRETNDGAAGNHTSEETETNISTAAMEAESETLEQLPEENEESQRTLVESQPEDEEGEKQVTSKERISEAERLVEEGKIDSAIQGKSDAMCAESSISHTQSADRLADEHQGEKSELGSEQDTTEPEGHSGDKVIFSASSQNSIHRISHICVRFNIINEHFLSTHNSYLS